MSIRKILLTLFILVGITGYSLNAADKPVDSSSSALYKAVKESNMPKIKDLISEGIDINQDLPKSSLRGEQPFALLLAINQHDFKLVKFLVINGADLEARNENGMTAIGVAAWLNDLEMVKFLIEKGAKVNVTRSDVPRGHPLDSFDYAEEALYWSLINGNVELAQFLLDKGAKIKTGKDSIGQIALLWGAIKSGNPEAVKLLIDQGIDLNATPPKGDRMGHSLFAAIKEGHVQIVKLLLENGASTNIENRDGLTPQKVIEKNISKLEDMKKLFN